MVLIHIAKGYGIRSVVSFEFVDVIANPSGTMTEAAECFVAQEKIER